MSNPILAEVTRGGIVESSHRGKVAVVDASGKTVLSFGDIESPVFPRSAVKSMQALPFIESGAADAYGFGNQELALSCSSHSGEKAHADLARSMIEAAGMGEEVLECGAHWSFQLPVAVEQAREMAKPIDICNNCSGKHAGFICTCAHSGEDVSGYSTYEHAIQGEIRGVMENLTGDLIGRENCGVDGCSIPTYAASLKGVAHGFAKMATGEGLPPIRAKAAKRLIEACMAEPFYVAGTKRHCTTVMEALPGRVFVKTGAEGVYIGAIPELGLGIALKCEDGATRGAECMVSAVLAKLLARDEEASAKLLATANSVMKNWNGIEVGTIRPSQLLM